MKKFVLFLMVAIQSYAADLTKQQQIVAITILAEARGEGTEGMAAVAAVIAQRAIERKQTFQKVCLAKYQFSCWNGKSIKDLTHLLSIPEAKAAKHFARNIKRIDRNIVNNANHYHATWMKKKPYWAKYKKPVKIIGQHAFYKL